MHLPPPPAPASTRFAPPVNRHLAIAGGVVLLHVAALWALQSGLLRRAVEVIVPVAVLSEIIEPPKPRVEPPPPPPPPAPRPPPVRQAVVPPPTPVLPPPPMPVAIPDPAPAPQAPVGVTTPPPAPPPMAAPVAPAAPTPPPPAPAPAPAPARVELPSTNADYLQNPKPVYPAVSRRLGEQGVVVHSVLIGADGRPVSARLVTSSGFPRLDQAAYNAVMGWRYVPGKRNGVAEAMSFNVPLNFVLD